MNTMTLNFFLDKYASKEGITNKDLVDFIDSYEKKNRPELFFLDLARFLQNVNIKKWQNSYLVVGEWYVLYTKISWDYYMAKKYFNEH